MTPAEHRLTILRKYARLGPSGYPSHCRPAQKITFLSRTAAEACARELAEWTPALEQDAYRCQFGSRRHFHLTKRREASP